MQTAGSCTKTELPIPSHSQAITTVALGEKNESSYELRPAHPAAVHGESAKLHDQGIRFGKVRRWSDKIALSLTSKTMPADASKPWPDEWIALFKRWVAEGCNP